MGTIREFTQSVKDNAELRNLEQFIAARGGRVTGIIGNTNGIGVSVSYELIETSD